MDELARQLGYLVFFAAAIYLINKLLTEYSDSRAKERAHVLITADLIKGISCRKIYQSTSDARILGETNRHFSDPLYLKLELDDSAYKEQLIKEGLEREYEAAMLHISSKGETCRLIEGQLVFRPVNGWQSSSKD